MHATAAAASAASMRADVNRRKLLDKAFVIVGLLVMFAALLVLVVLFVDLVRDGAPKLNWDFLNSFPSRKAERAGILSAWVGTSLIMLTTTAVTMPVGTASTPQPMSIMRLAMRRPRSVFGVMSPKPTVVIVVMAQ